MSAWMQLLIAGLLEVGWAVGLKYSEGFSRVVPSLLTLVALVASLWLLGLSTRSIPLGTAYAVWVGIGATGTALLGVLLFQEPLNLGRGAFMLLLVVAIAGLKLTSPASTP